MTERVKEILSWYAYENPGVKEKLYRMMMTGRLAGTGKFVILPVDQGVEHGPARSFAPNPAGYDPRYHFQLALESGCNAYAAPLGFLEGGADEYAGQLPLILKLNNNTSLYKTKNPNSAVTGSIADALRLGCAAIGFTIYPGTANMKEMLMELRELIDEARSCGLPTIVWSYPRGESLSKEGETGIDVAAYAAQMACQMGAHIVKVKPPTAHVEQEEAKKVYEKHQIPIGTLADRVRHVIQAGFAGRRIVIFSGGDAKGDDAVLEEIKQIAQGGGFGSIIGRNSFQRPKAEAIKLLQKIMDIYKNAG